MNPETQVLTQIEELRRKLHRGLGSQYDPVRIQELMPISEELDRLVVQVSREQLQSSGHDTHR